MKTQWRRWDSGSRHEATLTSTWDMSRYREMTLGSRRAMKYLVPLTGVCALAAAIVGRPVGFLVACLGALLVVLAVGFRRPIGFGPAALGTVLAYAGALWGSIPQSGSVVIIVSSFTLGFVFDCFVPGKPSWRNPDGT